MGNSLLTKQLLLGALALLGACAQQIPKLTEVTGNGDRVTSTVFERVCPDSQRLLNSSGSKLSEFFGTNIKADLLEGPVTYCLFVDDILTSASISSSADVETGFAIELEQGSSVVNNNDKDDGILFLEFGQTKWHRIKSVVHRNSDTDLLTIDLIYRDKYGLVRVKGSGTYGTAIRAEVSFYNFPSYEDAVTEAAERAKEACLESIANRDGTAAKTCWGLEPALTKAWWLQDVTTQPTQEQLLREAAIEVLDSDRARKLGEIDIDIDEVI